MSSISISVVSIDYWEKHSINTQLDIMGLDILSLDNLELDILSLDILGLDSLSLDILGIIHLVK